MKSPRASGISAAGKIDDFKGNYMKKVQPIYRAAGGDSNREPVSVTVRPALQSNKSITFRTEYDTGS